MNNLMNNLTFGTGNPRKSSEVSAILGIEIQGYTPEDLDLIEKVYGKNGIPEIQSMDVIEIVRRKAEDVYYVLGRPVIVEDSGLVVDGLGGFPGPLVKHVLEGPGLDAIFKMMSGVRDRTARAITGVCMFDGTRHIIGHGVLEGNIVLEPRGNEFGWSNCFEPAGTDKTFGEITEAEKNQISMRSIAFKDFIKNLELYNQGEYE